MAIKAPELKKCCFCVPLRYGLLAWGYIKLLGALLLMAYLLIVITFLISYHNMKGSGFTVLCIAILLVDIGFTVTFIVGTHKKLVNLLTIFFYYSVISLTIMVMMSLFAGIEYGLFDYFSMIVLEAVLLSGSVVIILVLHAYAIFLIKSEINKLQNNYNIRFVSNPADAECILQQREQENNMKINYS